MAHAPGNTPSASVIIPVYNGGPYLATAIESVLAQTYTDFELLLLNDGSTDDSPACLQAFADRDPRCQLHAWPNQGLIGTLNAGIRLARAPILIRMDADDICYPERFARQMDYLAAHPECVAVGCMVRLVDPDGLPIRALVEKTDHAGIDALHMAGRGGAGICHPAVAMRRDAVLACGAYRREFAHAEDIDLFLRLAEVGQLANLAEVLLDYRQHVGSIGYTHSDAQQKASQHAIEDACKRRGLPPPSGSARTDRRPTLVDAYRKWGWWALAGGYPKTARKYAKRAILIEPFSVENLKLLLCAWRGH